MKAVTLLDLASFVHPHDLPRTEASLIKHTTMLSGAELAAIANGFLRHEAHEAVVRLLFRRWSEEDLAAATNFLTQLPGRTAAIAAASIAARLTGKDAASARAWAVSLADMTLPGDEPLEMRPGVLNPFSHVLHRHTGGRSPVERAAWHTIINILSRRAPEQAVETWRQANARGVGCRTLVPGLVAAMSGMPGQALAFISELDDGDLALEALGSYAQSIAAQSPDQALELVGRMEQGHDRDQVLSNLLYAAPSIVGRVQKLYSENASDYEFSCIKHSLVSLGTREAVRQMVEYPDLIKWYRLTWEVFCDLLRSGEEEAKVRELLAEDLPATVLSGAASALATSGRTADARAAADLLRRFGPADDSVVSLVAESLAEAHGVEEAADLILSMPEDQRAFTWNRACRGGMRYDPAATITWCRDHWSEIPLKHPLRDAMWEWLGSDKSAAMASSRAQPDAQWRDRLLRIIVEHQAHGHPQLCAEMITDRIRMDDRALSDPVWIWLAAVVCTQWRAARQAEAAAWTGTLPHSPLREAAEAVVRGEHHCADYKPPEDG